MEEEKVGDITTTRRNLLKGIAVGASAIVGASVIANYGLSKSVYAKMPEVPIAQKYLVYDPALCMGCQTCKAVCSTIWNNGKTSMELARIEIYRDPFGTDVNNFEPNPCLQCTDPPCLKACPVGALQVDKKSGTNARVIDERICIGCGKCYDACPFEPKRIIGIDPERQVYIKCHQCYGDPQCVKWCPNGSLKYTDISEFEPKLTGRKLEVRNAVPYSEQYSIVLQEDRIKELGYPQVVSAEDQLRYPPGWVARIKTV